MKGANALSHAILITAVAGKWRQFAPLCAGATIVPMIRSIYHRTLLRRFSSPATDEKINW